MSEIKEIVRRVKQNPESGSVAEILEREKKERASELERLKIERMVEEERKRIQELKGEGKPVETKLASDFLSSVLQMANVDPKKAAEFIKELGEEDVRKMSILMAAGGNTAAAFMALAKSPSTDVKTMIEIAKLMQPQQPGQPAQPAITLEGVAAVFKTAFELAEKKAPPAPEPKASITTMIKDVMDTVKPFYDALAQKDREVFDLRLKQLESRIVDPREWYESVKADAEALGYVRPGPGLGGIDREVEKMKLEHEKWKLERDWEFQKWRMEMGLGEKREREKWKTIKDMITPALKKATPIIDAAVEEGEKRVRTGRGAPATTKISEGEAFTCLKCGFKIPTEGFPERITCPQCKTEYEKQK
jgi:hypothetical protein